MAREKTIEDYKLEVAKAKQSYLKSKMEYNWNYTFKEETEEDYIYFMIVNKFQATKILYSIDSQTLIKKDIYTMDVKTMTELQDQL